jgi:hypothetical protein
MEEIKKALEDIFGATFSNEPSEAGSNSYFDLQHFDGRLHWAVTLNAENGYVMITAGLKHTMDYVLEAHGFFDAVKVGKLIGWPYDGRDLPIEQDNRNWVVYLFPRGGNRRSESTYICRHSDGTIELETYMGKEPNPPAEIPA